MDENTEAKYPTKEIGDFEFQEFVDLVWIFDVWEKCFEQNCR